MRVGSSHWLKTIHLTVRIVQVDLSLFSKIRKDERPIALDFPGALKPNKTTSARSKSASNSRMDVNALCMLRGTNIRRSTGFACLVCDHIDLKRRRQEQNSLPSCNREYMQTIVLRSYDC